MRTCLLILLTIYTLGSAYTQENPASFVVLELFTSQGCSSCPPADRLLDEVHKNYSDKNIFVMSYHVDYWNRLGWKDPFSKAEFSDYQREYAIKFNSRSIYTPQVVVNGKEHFTGSDRAKMTRVIANYKDSKPKHKILLQTAITSSRDVKINYEIEGEEFYRVTFALIVPKRTTEVRRGENRNRELTNSNIVANRIFRNNPKGEAILTIPSWISEKEELRLIAYSQHDSFEITGIIHQTLSR